MLQKLENLYLAILRFVVLLVAGLLLVAVVMFGLSSFRALQPPPEEKKATPVVSDAAIKKAILEKEAAIATTPSTTTQTQKSTDPNQIFYDRAAQAISEFIKAHAEGQESVNTVQVANFIKGKAAIYEKRNLSSAFSKNFAENVEKLLKDQDVIAFAKQNSPLQTVNKILGVFIEQFDEQIEKSDAENATRQQQHLEKKAEGQQSIYFAAGSFGAFLMIVFLSIIIRIERNLRHLERAAA